ncbi:OLC1v1019420C1 [Oldenlandia corymbosa var. corymbosa]|uniref:OLC1v1019420C1 n=1 Tax=Oldenlandia corymbosa var. corymbosa TaxID=529605 RepID=A0AAV1EE11_OLDCO|nr:OLC1v1019420C1 [Oldenlandia corymbosa var. corymbosa]
MEIRWFDLKSESYGELEQPDYDEGAGFRHLYVMQGGCLAVCCYSCDGHADLRIMKEYGVQEPWTKAVLVPEIDANDFCFSIFSTKDEKILSWYNNSSLALFDPKCNGLHSLE